MTNKAKNAHTWLTGLLTGWGVKESWEENGYQEFASLEEAKEYFNIEE